MDLRIGEVWEDMAESLTYEHVRPVSPDLEMIQSAMLQTQALTSQLQKSQRALQDLTKQVFTLFVCFVFVLCFLFYRNKIKTEVGKRRKRREKR